jgi:hypothetical protein
MIYWVQSNIGFSVAVAITAATIIATLAIVYRLSLRICSRELVVVGLLSLSALMMLEFTKVRPQVFTWLFFAIFVRQLYLNYQGERVSLWVLPLLMVVWSNMHLGYLFGLMAMYVWLVCLFLRDRPTAFAHLRTPLVLTLLATLSPAISPVGPRALLVPLDYVASDRLAINTIGEWASPNFHSIAFAPLALGIAILLIVGLPLGRKHLFGLILSLVVVGMALTAQRNIALFAIVFPVVASQSIAERWPSQIGVPRPGVNSLNWAICVMTVLLMLAIVPSIGGQVHSEPNVSSGLPSEGVAYLREHPLGNRMLNSYDWGGYLIFELYPEASVSIDGRSDLYGDAILSQYLTVYNLKPGWREELAALNPDFILMPRYSPLAGELRYDAGWRLAFEGHVEMIFVPAKTSFGVGG